MHFLWALLFKWFVFSPNLLHLIPSSAHIKLKTWLSFNSILDFVCVVKISWISPINASFSFWALDLVIGPLGICKTSFELFICAGLNFSSWFSSPLSSGPEPTLTQETLKMTSVKQPTSRCQRPRQLFD